MDQARLWHRLLVKLRLRRPAVDLSRQDALQARPIRNPKLNWRLNDEGEAIITLPRREGRLWRFVSWVFAVPESRDVSLDEIGTHVWCGCDGEHTVDALIHRLMAEHRLSRREVEVSLTEYLRTLGKRGMVGFLVEQPPSEGADEPEETPDSEPDASSQPAPSSRRRGGRSSGRGRKGRRK